MLKTIPTRMLKPFSGYFAPSSASFVVFTDFIFYQKTVVSGTKIVYNNMAHQVLLTSVSLYGGVKVSTGVLKHE